MWQLLAGTPLVGNLVILTHKMGIDRPQVHKQI